MQHKHPQYSNINYPRVVIYLRYAYKSRRNKLNANVFLHAF